MKHFGLSSGYHRHHCVMFLHMASHGTISRRSFLAAAAAAAPLVSAAPQAGHIPVGLELYSVREELAKDLKGTVTAVAKMGYEVGKSTRRRPGREM